MAEALGTKTTAVCAIGDRLINHGVLSSPEYGQVAVALPLLDQYFRRWP